jgi:hypothetical protein
MTRSGLGFFLFLLLNAVLFIRPSELIPSLEGAQIYEAIIFACLAISFPEVVRQLAVRSLAAQPIAACVLGVAAAAVLSRLAHFELGGAVEAGVEVGKLLAYFLLFIGVVNSVARLRAFLAWLVVLIAALTVLSLMQYHGVIDVPSMSAFAERQDEIDADTGEQVVLSRLCGAGIFQNPNDLSRILIVGMTVCAFCLFDGPRLLRLLLLPPLGLFGYALSLTFSRGGLLDLLAGAVVLCGARLGKWKTIGIVIILIPALLWLYKGRQTNITTSEGTGRQRVELWSDGLAALKESPVFGIGMNQYREVAGGYVAHNSFVQCYVELGIVGGAFFVGAFALALWGPFRAGSARFPAVSPALLRLRPCILALLAGYGVGMFSSTRSYSLPTYLLLGLAAVYCRLAPVSEAEPLVRMDRRLAVRLAGLSVVVLAAIFVFVRFSLFQE